jgi:hypothetical protein
MRGMTVRAAWTTLAILLTVTVTFAQPGGRLSGTPASELRIVVDELQVAAARANAPDTLSTRAGWLHDSVFRPPDWKGPVTNPDEVTRDYARSLQLAAELIRQNPPKQALADIAADLETKVEHCQRLGIGMGGVVRVRVNTRRGGDIVRNLQVRYLLKFYEYIKGAQPGTFPQFSSPTEETLSPGRYWMWTFDPATGRETTRTLVKVAGQREMVVDVPVT